MVQLSMCYFFGLFPSLKLKYISLQGHHAICECVCFISPITNLQAFDCWWECFAIGVTPALRVSLSYTHDNNLAGIQT